MGLWVVGQFPTSLTAKGINHEEREVSQSTFVP
jgi:hypothetical protein